jgi:hypothetical protein
MFELGKTFWVVYEHCYRIDGQAALHKEFCVTEAEPMSFICGHYEEISLRFFLPDGGERIGYVRIKQIGMPGGNVFLSAEEAAAEAERRADRYDCAFSFCSDTQIRRT